MELDDLKTAWDRLDARTGALEALVHNAYKDAKLERSRRMLRGLTVCQAIAFAIWLGVVVMVVPFWIEHRHVPHLLAAGLTLHIYGIAAIWATVMQLLLIGRVYHTAPVVMFQRRMAELQRFQAITSLALGIPWWILWVVITMVGAKWLFNLDLYAQSPGWIQVSLGIGLVGMALTVWVARRFAARPPGSPALRRIVDDLSGHSLRRVICELDDLARFERE